jgi:hypothetical protein
MHPEIAKTLVAQHRDELIRHPRAAGLRAGRRRFPRWRISWTRTVLAPARGRSVVIIISAHRSA